MLMFQFFFTVFPQFQRKLNDFQKVIGNDGDFMGRINPELTLFIDIIR